MRVTPKAQSVPWCYAVLGQNSQRRALIESYLSLCVAEAAQRPRNVSLDYADVIFCNDDDDEIHDALKVAGGRTVVSLGNSVKHDQIIALPRPLSARSFSWLMEVLAELRDEGSEVNTRAVRSVSDGGVEQHFEQTVLMKALSFQEAQEALSASLKDFSALKLQPSALRGDAKAGAAGVSSQVGSDSKGRVDTSVSPEGGSLTADAALGEFAEPPPTLSQDVAVRKNSAQLLEEAKRRAAAAQTSRLFDNSSFAATRAGPATLADQQTLPLSREAPELAEDDPDFPSTRQGEDPLVVLQSKRGAPSSTIPLGIAAAASVGMQRYVLNTAAGATALVDVQTNLVIEPGSSVSRLLAAPMDACWVSALDAEQPLEFAEGGRALSLNRLCWQLAQVAGTQPRDELSADSVVFVPRSPNLGGTPVDPPFVRLMNRLLKSPASIAELEQEASPSQVQHAVNFLLLMGSLEISRDPRKPRLSAAKLEWGNTRPSLWQRIKAVFSKPA